MLIPYTYIIVLIVFFKLLLWQKSTQPYFILKVQEGRKPSNRILKIYCTKNIGRNFFGEIVSILDYKNDLLLIKLSNWGKDKKR